jgi:hypothetical protein
LPVELAQAAVMGALCAVIAIISVVVPLAYRYRLRVLIASAVAAGVITFLIAGLGGLLTVVHCVYTGGLTGLVKRKGRGLPTVLFSSLIAGVAFAAVMVGMLAMLGRLRHLLFQVVTANADGASAVLNVLHLPN